MYSRLDQLRSQFTNFEIISFYRSYIHLERTSFEFRITQFYENFIPSRSTRSFPTWKGISRNQNYNNLIASTLASSFSGSSIKTWRGIDRSFGNRRRTYLQQDFLPRAVSNPDNDRIMHHPWLGIESRVGSWRS